MEPIISGFLAVIAEYPFGAGLLIAASGYGVYRWKKPELEGTKGMNGGEVRIYKKLDEMSAASDSRGEASERRHSEITARVETVAGHVSKIYGRLGTVETDTAVMKALSEERRAGSR